MKKIILLLIIPFISYSQNIHYGNNSESIKICTALQIKSFSSNKAAESALDKILGAIGAAKRFVLKPCSNINNAVAFSFKGVRYIMYDPEFMSELSYSNDWVNMFILAHEVGHHVNNHTIDILLGDAVEDIPLFQQRMQELEADEFAGFVLGRLGAKFSQIENVFRGMSDSDDTYSTHPKRSKRISATRKGFSESGGKVNLQQKENRLSVKSKYSNKKYSDVTYTIKTTDNYRYEGTVDSNGKLWGIGKIFFESGVIYEGEFAGGLRNGYGIYKFSNGASYEGEFVNDDFTGFGTYTQKDGIQVIGQWKDWDENGKMLITGPDETDWISEMEYNDGNIILVTHTHKTTNEVEKYGFLDNLNGNGYSTYTFNNGAKLTANFEKGVIKPSERFYELTTTFRKQGDKYWSSMLSRNITSKIGGNSSNGPFFGYGEMKWESGSEYKGYYFTGTKNRAGYGEMIWGDDNEKKSYKGMWWDSKKNGYGTLTYKDGRIESGIFRDDKFVRTEKFKLNKIQEYAKRF